MPVTAEVPFAKRRIVVNDKIMSDAISFVITQSDLQTTPVSITRIGEYQGNADQSNTNWMGNQGGGQLGEIKVFSNAFFIPAPGSYDVNLSVQEIPEAQGNMTWKTRVTLVPTTDPCTPTKDREPINECRFERILKVDNQRMKADVHLETGTEVKHPPPVDSWAWVKNTISLTPTTEGVPSREVGEYYGGNVTMGSGWKDVQLIHMVARGPGDIGMGWTFCDQYCIYKHIVGTNVESPLRMRRLEDPRPQLLVSEGRRTERHGR
jgi:hypothetical protein